VICQRSLSTQLAASLAFSILCLGCSGPSYRPAESNVSSARTVRQSLDDSKKNVNGVLAALSDISAQAGADPRPAYDRFTAEIAGLKKARDSVKSNAEDMRARSKQYFDAWKADMEAMQSPEIRAKAAESEQKAREAFASIQSKGDEAKAAYEPFLSTVEDLNKYLRNSLNPQGIATVKDSMDKAKSLGGTLLGKIDAVIAELDRMANALSATPSPAGAGGTPPQ
jgi:hypothetical protein